MGDERQTLREYLDSIGCYAGDDRGFVLYKSFWSPTRYEVSRRYLESAPYEHLLEKPIFSITHDANMFGQQTICITLDN